MSKRKPNDQWKVDVKFQQSGALLATATGVLLVPPKDAVAFVTDAAGDALFRVMERKELTPSPTGCRRVEVTNQAAIRVLAWKLWSKSNVIYEIESTDRQGEAGQQTGLQEERVTFELVSSSMLQSLTGSWQFRPIIIHTSDLPLHIRYPFGATAAAAPAAAPAAGSMDGNKAALPSSSSNNSPYSFKMAASLHAPVSSSSSTAQPTDTISSWSPGHLRVRTLDPKHLDSTAFKPSLLQKLSLVSPKSQAAAAAAAAGGGGVFGSHFRPVVQITARTSSGHSAEPLSAVGSILAADSSQLAANGSKLAAGGSILATGGKRQSSSLSGGSEGCGVQDLPKALSVDADGFVTATYVHYEQLAQPKGMPPGIRNVPGLSYAVAASVGKEVRQMLDKVSCVSHYAVSQGLGPQDALRCVVQQMQAAGGSFKALQKQLHKEAQQKQLASAEGSGTAAAAAEHAEATAVYPLCYSDLQLTACRTKNAKADVQHVSNLSGRAAAAAADETAVMTAVLNPVLQPLSMAEGLVGMRELMSHPVSWMDGGDLDD